MKKLERLGLIFSVCGYLLMIVLSLLFVVPVVIYEVVFKIEKHADLWVIAVVASCIIALVSTAVFIDKAKELLHHE